MAKNNVDLKPSNELRKRAEDLLSQRVEQTQSTGDKNAEKLIHELQVHRIELEMQNVELRRSQAELEESKQRYADLYDLAPVGYLVLDPEGVVLNVNLTAASLLNLERRRLIKRKITDFIASEFQDVFYLHRKRVFESRTRQTCELQLVKKDDTPFYASLESIAKQDVDGKFLQINTTITDIDRRKLAEKTLRESEQRFRLVADFAYDWEYWIGPDCNYIYVSPSCERITGYRPDEFIQDSALFNKIIHPDDCALVDEHFNKELSRKNVKSLDFRIRSRDGEERWIAHICQPVYDDDGQFVGRRASNRDITDRKRMEAALYKAQDELERRVENRTIELNATAEKLKTKQKQLLRHKSKLELVNKDILETNKAVSVLARNIERQKDAAEKEIVQIIRSRAMPILEEFQRNKAFGKYRPEIDELMMTFSKLTPGSKKNANIVMSLTSTELRIASMVKNGLTSWEIANLLHISLDTVKTHRRNIRRKLGLNNAKFNLASYLEANMD